MGKRIKPLHNHRTDQRFTLSLRSNSTELFGQQVVTEGAHLQGRWSFIGGSRVIFRPKLERFVLAQKAFGINASCDPSRLFYYISYDLYQRDERSCMTEIPSFYIRNFVS